MNALENVMTRLVGLGKLSFSQYNRLYKVEIKIAGNTYDTESINLLDACIQLFRIVGSVAKE